jgi:predicted metal-dependent phosphoesterase TrpH
MVIDFHIHSKYSFDCFLEPALIIDRARRLGLDGLAVTDHDTTDGVAEFRRLAPDLCIIAGQEITTRLGDVLGLFLTSPVAPHADADVVIRAIRAQGGLAVLAHPFKWPHVRRDPEVFKKFDAVEVFNARNNIPVPYLENWRMKREAVRLGLRGIAGSDTHEGFELGCAATVFDMSREEATDERLKDAIRQGRVNLRGREVFLGTEIVSHFSRNFRSLFR